MVTLSRAGGTNRSALSIHKESETTRSLPIFLAIQEGESINVATFA
jgi:hypothetical protein